MSSYRKTLALALGLDLINVAGLFMALWFHDLKPLALLGVIDVAAIYGMYCGYNARKSWVF